MEPLVGLRAALRTDGRYELADAVRAALAAGHVQLRDRLEGTVWHLRDSHQGWRP